MDPFEFLRPISPKRRFAKRVIARLRKLGWIERMFFDEASFSVDAGGDAGIIYLSNLHAELRRAPFWRRRRYLDDYLAYVFEPRPELSFEDAKPLLMPIVRNRGRMGFARLEQQDDEHGGFAGAVQPLGEVLAALCAVDRPKTTKPIDAAQLAAWGCNLEEVMGIALRNLGLKSPARFKAMTGGFHVSDYGDYHDASRMLLPHLFNGLRLKGAPVVVAVSRACLVVAGSEDLTALEAMARFVRDTMKDEIRPISYAPMVLIDGAWGPFRPDDVERVAMRDLWLTQWFWDAQQQTPMLQSDFEARGADIFAAPLRVVAIHGAPGCRWSSWKALVPTCLPQADVLILIDHADVAYPRLWVDVEGVLGSFEALPDIWPPRFMTPPWPDEEAWRRLVACPVAPGFGELEGALGQ